MARRLLVWVRKRRDAAKARGGGGPYRGDRVSLSARLAPAWFADAKFGVLIHWGLYSVPGFAVQGRFTDIIKRDYDHLLTAGPYAEDYWNAMKDPDSPTAKHHEATYGALPYEAFMSMFEEELAGWDPDEWARLFEEAGARYVIFTAKYADGFCLWPTRVENPHHAAWHTNRDLVGELAQAVRAHGMKFGVYYSGGQDWTFQRRVVHTIADYAYLSHGNDYADYADAQVRELVDLYKPDVLWNDISWPTGEERALSLFAYYYNAVPDGVINDRWTTPSLKYRLLGTWVGRKFTDALIKLAIGRDPAFVDNIRPPDVPHSDFITPEYSQYPDIQIRKWEMTRGMGESFGYKKNDIYDSFGETLLPSFIDAVSKNGNLLLNVGPAGGSGRIPEEQRQILANFGSWLGRNAEGVYGTTPWKTAEAVTTDGRQVHFTTKAGRLYVFLSCEDGDEVVTIVGVTLGSGRARVLGETTYVQLAGDGTNTVVRFSSPMTEGSFVLELL